MKSLTEYSFIKDGKLNNRVTALLKELVASHEGRFIKIEVTQGKKRSNSQNAYYHGCIIPFYQQGVKEMWDEDVGHDEAHEDLKKYCNYKEKVNEETGEVRRFTKSTTKLSTTEFEEYNERCRRLIQEYFGITVPLPNEQMQLLTA